MPSVSTHSLERLVPEELADGDATGLETFELHLARYEFAARCVREGAVLDIACGVGYGTRLLADRGEGRVRALGVDVAPDAVEHARARYGGPRVEYRLGDAMTFEAPEPFDAIVSLETIEHVDDPGGLVDHLLGLLRPGGTYVASVPTTPSVDVNPHHRHDFTEASFRRLFERHGLREEHRLEQVQPVNALAVLRRSEKRMSDLRPNLPAWYLRHPAALLRRIGATLRFGFTNRYLTIAWRSPT